ncbi:MAG: DUF5060 domain-containing protein [Bacteroidota bacterium]
MMKKFFPAALLLVFAGNLLFAQISKITLLNPKPGEYGKAEWDIRLIANWENPYLQEDITLDMLLTTPSGKKLVLPCYYELGESGQESLWKARFAPQEIGRYTYIFKLRKGNTEVGERSGTFTSYPSKKNGFLHAKSNWAFEFDNGKPFRGIGENIGWESRKNDDSKFFKALHELPKYNYEYMLPSLARHGGNFYRTWISAFNLPLDWHRNFNSTRYEPSDAYFNPSAIKKIDRMFTLADSLGVYVMLTLGQGNYSTRDGGFSPNAADFFVNPKSKERYKNRLRYFIARWGYCTSIGAWELFNEVDNVQFGNKNKPISADSIVTWHDEMSAYIKQTDPYKHLVTTSISHRDLKGLNSLVAIDFNQKHIYKNTATIPAAIVKYEQDFGKPYVIGEYGFEWDWSKNFDEFAPDMDSDFKRGMWYGLFSPTPILPMSWWWEYFDNRGTDAYFDRIKTISDQMLAAGKGSFEQVRVTASVTDAKMYAVKCGDKLFVYAFNPTDIVQKTDIEFDGDVKFKYLVTAFDCETGKYIKTTLGKPGTQQLNIKGWNLPAKSDVVFVISKIE